MKCYELIPIPIPHPTCTALGEEIEELGVKLILGRKEGWGEGDFSSVFTSHYSTVLLTGNKLNYFPQV